MSKYKLYREIIELLLAITIVCVAFIYHGETWVILGGLGLVLWAIREIIKETRRLKSNPKANPSGSKLE